MSTESKPFSVFNSAGAQLALLGVVVIAILLMSWRYIF
jgi:hypothetical protein